MGIVRSSSGFVFAFVEEVIGGLVVRATWMAPRKHSTAPCVAEPPKLLGPHAPVLVSKTSDGYACAPDNLTGSVRVPQRTSGKPLTTRIAGLIKHKSHTPTVCSGISLLQSYKLQQIYIFIGVVTKVIQRNNFELL